VDNILFSWTRNKHSNRSLSQCASDFPISLKFFILILVKDHYTGNKSRNALVRQDFPHALDEQRREEQEAAAVYQQQ
jgi:hypothetical protein